MNERCWASGHWQVNVGEAEEFIQQRKEWLSRSSENAPVFTKRGCFVHRTVRNSHFHI